MARKPVGPHPRNRVINFRLDEIEFAAFQTVCRESGSRTASDFVRDYILKNKKYTAQPTENPDTAVIQRWMTRVNARLARIEDRMAPNGKKTNTGDQ